MTLPTRLGKSWTLHDPIAAFRGTAPCFMIRAKERFERLGWTGEFQNSAASYGTVMVL